MTKITVSNFRGIRRAEFEAAGITLLAGHNGSGKSSLLQGIAAATTGVLIPIDKLTKGRSNELIFDGDGEQALRLREASITVASGIGSSTVTYPAGTRASEGKPFDLSKIAAGVDSLIYDPITDKPHTDAERVQMISELVQCEPRYEDLLEALSAMNMNPEHIKRLWQTIKAQGWDSAYDGAKNKGKEIKGEWKAITGGNYGTQVAENWLPDAWTDDLKTETADTLTAVIAECKSWVNAAIADQAVGDAEIARLRAAAEQLPGLQTLLDMSQKQLPGLRKNEKLLQDKLESIAVAQTEATTACPHCGKPVVIKGLSVVIPSPSDPEAISKATKLRADCVKELANIKAEIGKVNAEIGGKNSQIITAMSAKTQLEGIAVRSTATDNSRDLETCRAELATAESRLLAWKMYHNARAKHEAIILNQRIIDLLAPEGLRMARLTEALAEINGLLDEICKRASWPTVSVLPDMSFIYGKRAYMHCSASQKYRVRVSLQIVWAIKQGSPLILIDEADKLDASGRQGLIVVCHSLLPDTRSIIGMTIIGGKDKVPDMSKLIFEGEPCGAGYWIENGEVV